MQKIWLKNYQAGVPELINPDAYPSLNDILEEACIKYAQRPAFTNMGQTLSYAELEHKTRAFACYLQQQLKLTAGTRVAVMLPNILQYPIAMFGILRMGGVVVNVNPLYTPSELRHQLLDSGAEAIVVLENFASTLAKIVSVTQVKQVIVTEIGDELPGFKRKLVNFVVRHVKKMIPKWDIPQAVRYGHALQQGEGLIEQYTNPNLQGTDIAYLQYTGGTTGKAKGAILTHRNMIANLEQSRAWMSAFAEEGKDIIITALPLYHIFSLTANCLAFMRVGGLNVLITNPRDQPSMIATLKKHKFTVITGVNTLFNALLNQPKIQEVDFSHLKIALGGGMAIQAPVAERWQKLTQKPLLEAYGLTETSPAACINPLHLTAYNGTVGVPIPSTEVTIRDGHNLDLGPNQTGELLIRGPQVMRGYWQQEEETRKVLSEDGWLRTGDIATMDEKGFVRIVDRKKDMILISGFNVYPNEVEEVIAQLSQVIEVAVVGVPDEVRGEQAKAFVVRNSDTLTPEIIIEHCRTRLAAYKVPKLIEFRDELPKTNVGKILRRALK